MWVTAGPLLVDIYKDSIDLSTVGNINYVHVSYILLMVNITESGKSDSQLKCFKIVPIKQISNHWDSITVYVVC